MFNQYESTVKATIEFLRLLKVKVNGRTVNETLQNHPDWPSLLCISDSLNKWNVSNGAGKIDPNNIDELPTPFIAYTHKREEPLTIIKQVTESNILTCQKDYKNTVIENKRDFKSSWNGVYLIAEPNECSGEPDFDKHKRKNFFASLIPIAAFIAFTSISILLLVKNINNSAITNSFTTAGIYLQYCINLTGFIVALLLLWHEIDKNNPLLQKVCSGISKGNCNAILSGKAANLFSWLSWSEVGFFYFAGAMLCLLFANTNLLPVISLIAAFNMVTIPYPFFSIYYQWRVAKQWCVLCLAVQALLVLGIINSIVTHLLNSFSAITLTLLLQSFLLYLLPALIWFTLKPFILKLQEARNTKREYQRIKFNTEIFDTLLQKQKKLTIPADGLGIDLGNPSANNTLIKVCNPYCRPCSIAHSKIEILLKESANLKIKIIFTAPNKEEHPALKPVSHLLAIAENSKEDKIKKALDDWYLTKVKNYEQFASKYPLNGELLKQSSKVDAMDKWCEAMDINFTPTFFLNGYQLPDAYSIEDLKYFLLD
ncbi:MAG: thioredoxin domain-containing protein [Chitinophagaceae bacterium]|nr:thioredoxin domain-containing protein [Chitinophagaceae bacterium]